MRITLHKTLDALDLFLSLLAIVSLIYFHGFRCGHDYQSSQISFSRLIFLYYGASYFLRHWTTGHLLNSIRDSFWETLFYSYLIIDTVSFFAVGVSISSLFLGEFSTPDRSHAYALATHSLLVIVAGINLVRASWESRLWKLSPLFLIVLSYLSSITFGACILMMPEMANDPPLTAIDAFFMAISALTVTGLVVVDTASQFTFKGQVVLLILIQLGGLNIISFATFLVLTIRQRAIAGVNHALKRTLELESSLDIKKVISKILRLCLIVELVGAFLIFWLWPAQFFDSVGEQIFHSLFLAVSAFNNAGFTLLPNGLLTGQLAQGYSMHIVLALLIILGGLGFTTIADFWSALKPKNWSHSTRERIPLGSLSAFISAVILITVGMLLFFAFEGSGSLNPHPLHGQMVTAFFQSVTARNAGFHTVEIDLVAGPGLFLLMILMFIGTASGSTGGGIKTSTVSILVLSAWDRLFQQSKPSRIFASGVVTSAMLLVNLSLIFIALMVLVLLFSEQEIPFLELLFESVSAFSTVGLSTGITTRLSEIGKLTLMVGMFVGKVGPFSLIYMISPSEDAKVEDCRCRGVELG